MAQNCYHPSIEGAQHGAKSLPEFLDYAKRSGAAGAQPSNYMLQGDKGFQKAKDIKRAFEDCPPFPSTRRRQKERTGNREMGRILSPQAARSLR